MGLARLVRSSLFVLLALAATMPGCLRRSPVDTGAWPQKPAPGSFYAATGVAAGPAELAGLARDARYLLIGEAHTSMCDHLAQAAVLNALAEAGIKPAVGLEMIPADKQGVLDDFNAGKLSVAELKAAVDWETVWGYDYAMYAPVFEVARKYGLPLFALNSPKDLIRQAAEGGLNSVAPDKRALLPRAVIPPPPEQEDMLRAQFDAHKSMDVHAKPGSKQAQPKPAPDAPGGKPANTKTTPDTPGGQAVGDKAAQRPKPAKRPGAPAQTTASFERFSFVQSLWDTQMAERAVAANKATGRPVVVMAGGGHVEFGFGIAHRLSVLDPGAKTVSLVGWRGGEPPEPGEADAYFYCPLSHKSRLGFTVEVKDDRAVVTEVASGSKAETAGMRTGDVIVRAGGKTAATPGDLHKAAIEALAAAKPLVLTVTHTDGRSEDINLEIGPPPGPADK